MSSNTMCTGCIHNQFPYCYSDNHPSGFIRLDQLPENFMCVAKEMETKEQKEKEKQSQINMEKSLQVINTKLNKILKIIKKWE